MCNAGDPHNFMNQYMLLCLDALVDIQYGDEGGFNQWRVGVLQELVRLVEAGYPRCHANLGLIPPGTATQT